MAQTAVKSFGISVTGKSHLERKMGCQDACLYLTLENGWCASLIADGVGSKRCAADGATKAVAAAAGFIQRYPLPVWSEENIVALLRMAFATALHEVSLMADAEKSDLADYDSTLTIAVYNGRYFGFGHCGDGGIVAMDMSGELFVPTQRQKGESYNSVSPLRNHAKWCFEYSHEPVKSIVLMTDGLFDYAQIIWMDKPDPGLCFDLLQPVGYKERSVDNLNDELQKLLANPPYSNIGDDLTLVVMVNSQLPSCEFSEENVLKYRQAREEKRREIEQKQESEGKGVTEQSGVQEQEALKAAENSSKTGKIQKLSYLFRLIERWLN